jgi:2,4-diaminopentanoate dehydrogenase
VFTERDLEVDFGSIPAGTCGAVRTVAGDVVHGREAIVVEHIIRMARDVAPEWPTSNHDATYLIEIEGDPDIQLRLSPGSAEAHDAGGSAMAPTANRVVNAIPLVVAGDPGLLSSLDMALTVPRDPCDSP